MFEFKAGDMIVGRLHKEPVMLKESVVGLGYPLITGQYTYTKYGFYDENDAEPSIRLETGKQAEIGERPFDYPIIKRWKPDGEIAKFTALCTKEVLVKGNKDYSYDVGAVSTDCHAHTHPNWEDCEAPETLYDGLTEAQWEQVKKEKLLCTAYDIENYKGRECDTLDGFSKCKYPFFMDGANWRHCRIHHSQPQFVINGKKPDWLDDNAIVSVLFDDDAILTLESCEVNWKKAVRFQVMAKL